MSTIATKDELFQGIPSELVNLLESKYSEPGRYYHDWSHVLACLNAFSQERFQNPMAVRLAILFHDVIYFAGAKDNESKSADLARELMTRFLKADAELSNDVTTLILKTKNHWSHAVDRSDDTRLFLDIDIGILGQPWDVYTKYSEGVRKEWAHSSRSTLLFDFGRLHFLNQLAKRDSIFLTPKFREKFDSQAKSNILREMSETVSRHGLVFRAIAKVIGAI